MPPDVVSITDAAHAALLDGQAAGQVIAADADGRPVLADAPVAAPAETAVPAAVSRRQFALALLATDYCTQAEALAYSRVGELPAALAALLVGLPDESRWAAELALIGATRLERAHPLVAQLAALSGWGETEVDDFFRLAAAL